MTKYPVVPDLQLRNVTTPVYQFLTNRSLKFLSGLYNTLITITDPVTDGDELSSCSLAERIVYLHLIRSKDCHMTFMTITTSRAVQVIHYVNGLNFDGSVGVRVLFAINRVIYDALF